MHTRMSAAEFKRQSMSKLVRTRAEQVFDLRKDLNSIIDKGGEMSFNAKKRMRSLRVPVSRFAKDNTGKLHKPGKAAAVRTVPNTEWSTV